jgi:hypothetical protein
MVARLPDCPSSPLDATAAATVRPTSEVGRGPKRAGGSDQPSAMPTKKLLPASLKREAGERARPVAGSASDPSRATIGGLLVERLSVIDVADRTVYSETRDRKGWRQPLAAEEAFSDARRRGGRDGADGGGAGARIVQTFESEQERRSGLSPAGASDVPARYALGKARVLATNTGQAFQPPGSARQQLAPAVRDTATTRARTR